jgi:predicted transposase YbfD/YdcC
MKAAMKDNPFESIHQYFGELPDPRVEGRCDHKLIDIICVAIAAIVCGANSWSEVETFGKAKAGWLRHYLELPNGIPSHDTFGRVFSLLDAAAFEARFASWVEGMFHRTRGQVVAVDGKTARRSHDRSLGREAIHLISAWASANRLVLGQRKVEDNSNEITAVPDLLRLLDVMNCVVTLDAMGCQKEIAQTILDRKADYVLAVKQNQGQLYDDIHEWFLYAHQVDFENLPHSYHQTVNKTSGRVETRRCWAIGDPLAFEYIRHHEGWAALQTIVMIHHERRTGDQTQTETRYFISSLPPDAPRLLDCVRQHWSVENTCHWTLDVVFREDDSRVRIGHAPRNFALLRRFALNLLKQDAAKGSLKQKRFRAALNEDYLAQLLSQV